MKDKVVEFDAVPVKKIYEADDFRMYGCELDKQIFPEIKMNKFSNVCIKGTLQELSDGQKYHIKAEELYDNAYGYSYRVLQIRVDKPRSGEEMYNFLKEILTPDQALVLWKEVPDIVDRVKEGRIKDIDLSKLPGIGVHRFKQICEKIEKNYCYADIISEFHGIFSYGTIIKLSQKYPSAEKIREELNKRPYKFLTSIDRIGFKKADMLLLDMEKEGIIKPDESLRESKQRCMAFITFTLKQNEDEGNTKMSLRNLQELCKKEVKECALHFVECIKSGIIHIDKKDISIGLQSTYNTEKYLADRLIEGVQCQNIYDIDISRYKTVNNDTELTDEQMQGIENLCKYNVSILDGCAGCVDCDTEYFNGEEWVRIADYKNNDRVLQYNEDGTAELVFPLDYIKNKSDKLWHFETKYGLDQTLSLNHNVYYITSKGNLYHKSFEEVKQDQENNRNGFCGKFITSFKFNGSGINLTDDEIRLSIAVFADGHFADNTLKKTSSVYGKVRMNLKKGRKKRRLEHLLERMQIDYKSRDKRKTGIRYTEYYFVPPIIDKHFPKEWYNCSKEQLEVIATEIMCWDGNYNIQNNYSTTNKEDADFIQFVFSALGYRTTISINNRVGQNYVTNNKIYQRKLIEYNVQYTKRNFIGINADCRRPNNKTKIIEVPTKDGYQYCFTVPSHMLVLRRNNKIFITGNSGKTATTKQTVKMLKSNNKSFLLLAPTGRAAKVLSEYANYPAFTIHRGLGYNPKEGWLYCKDNPLNKDVVIVDEFSMVDVFLFRHLLEAIDFTRTKLLMIGDSAQLNSVQAGNCLHNMMDSKIIPTTTLTKIFRYGEGGLMTVATDTRLCKPFLNPDEITEKATSFGQNKDYIFIRARNETIIKDTLALYQKILSLNSNPEDVLVLSSYNKGDYGTVILNNKLQMIANPICAKQSEDGFATGKRIYYRNDLILQTVNDYRVKKYDINKNEVLKDECMVCNGEIGKVYKILKYGVVIKFDNNYTFYNKKSLLNTQLGYAVSIHRSQGGSNKIIILITPDAHQYMLNSNLLYVGLTRMKEKCYQLGNISTINRAVKKKENLERKTYLLDLLTESIKSDKL